jgi:hypothetical protein
MSSLEKVAPGQRARSLPAGDWNAFVDAARSHRSGQLGVSADTDAPGFRRSSRWSRTPRAAIFHDIRCSGSRVRSPPRRAKATSFATRSRWWASLYFLPYDGLPSPSRQGEAACPADKTFANPPRRGAATACSPMLQHGDLGGDNGSANPQSPVGRTSQSVSAVCDGLLPPRTTDFQSVAAVCDGLLSPRTTNFQSVA